jgi:adhesin transport system membrane fusion protein
MTPPPEHDRVTNPDRRYVLLAAGTVLALLIWAALSPIDRVVRAQGRIVTLGRAQIVQHLEGGIIREINVHEGDAVDADQILLRIADIRSTTQLGEGRTRTAALQAKLARLLAEFEGRERIDFPASLTDAAARAAEDNVFSARRAKLAQELSVSQQQATQRKSELAEAQSSLDNLNKELALAKNQLHIVEGLYKKDGASQLEYIEAQSRVQKISSQHQAVTASLPRLAAGLSEAQAKQAEIRATWRTAVSDDLALVRLELERSNLDTVAGADRVMREYVRSPVKGVVNRLHVQTQGGVVRPGEPLLEITPSDSALIAEAQVNPNDRAQLHPGLPAKIRVGAYDVSRYGTLEGKLTEVSADTLSNERGEHFYRVTFEVLADKAWLDTQRLTPGMTITADIVLGQRTVADYLISPLSRSLGRALRESK